MILLMDNDRAVRCANGDIGVDIITCALGPWRDHRAHCCEVTKKRRVSCSFNREGQVIRIRHLDVGDLVRDCELMIFSVSRWRGERGKQGQRRGCGEYACGSEAQM
jgi:hypothetical protein